MLAIGRRMANLVLAASILLYAMRGHAKVLQPYEEVVNNSKYGKELEKRMVDARDSGNPKHIKSQGGD